MAGLSTQRVQLLADALAMEFSLSMASAQCTATLKRLIGGLEYLSIAVNNPAMPGCIVTSSNCAAEGPTTLHLHDAFFSAAGLALSQQQPLQLSLLNGDGLQAVLAWTDVQQMLAQAPAVTHLLCLPFGGAPAEGGAVAEQAACLLHEPAGSGHGALLFGLSCPPGVDGRRAALLAMLLKCLPDPMARLSGNTLAFVNLACGSALPCTCCSSQEDEGREEEEGGDRDSCGSGGEGRGGHDHGGPRQALRVPSPAASVASDSTPGPSSRQPSTSGSTTAGEASKAASPVAPSEPGFSPAHSRGSSAAGKWRDQYSAQLLAAASRDSGVARQSAATLAFRLPLMERDYGRWAVKQQLRSDLTMSLLLLSALVIVAFVRPYRLVEEAPGSVALGLGVGLPLALIWLARGVYLPLRAWVIAVFRIYSVAFVNLVCIRAYLVHMGPERVHNWAWFWRLTGAESLCVTALAFRTPLRLHVPLQATAFAIILWNVPNTCGKCFPEVPAARCFRGSVAMALACGCLLPTLGVRYMEQRSRTTFAQRLRSVAAHED